jgi:hypothetical protein
LVPAISVWPAGSTPNAAYGISGLKLVGGAAGVVACWWPE